MFVDEVIVLLSLPYDLVNVLAGVSLPVMRLTPVASTVRRM